MAELELSFSLFLAGSLSFPNSNLTCAYVIIVGVGGFGRFIGLGYRSGGRWLFGHDDRWSDGWGDSEFLEVVLLYLCVVSRGYKRRNCGI